MDTLRGACCVLMAGFHLVYALVAYYGFPVAWLGLPVVQGMQLLSSRGFILLSGMACRLSRSNVRRGIFTLCCGLAVSGVSVLWGDPILFGILHFMGCAAVVYGLCKPLLERVPPLAGLAVSLVCYLAAKQVFPLYTESGLLFPLGFVSTGFRSSDYYPLLPYIFLFLVGSYFMQLLRENKRADEWLTKFSLPVLEPLGRNALLFYALHQPAIVGILAVIFWVI